MDITYLPMQRGFIYLAAVMDWATRRVLAWRVSNTLTADFCVEAVEEAIARYGKPEIFNTDQGSQGEFNWWSQHLDNGGVKWDDHEVGFHKELGGRRCTHRGGQGSISARPNWRFGPALQKGCRVRPPRWRGMSQPLVA